MKENQNREEGRKEQPRTAIRCGTRINAKNNAATSAKFFRRRAPDRKLFSDRKMFQAQTGQTGVGRRKLTANFAFARARRTKMESGFILETHWRRRGREETNRETRRNQSENY